MHKIRVNKFVPGTRKFVYGYKILCVKGAWSTPSTILLKRPMETKINPKFSEINKKAFAEGLKIGEKYAD